MWDQFSAQHGLLLVGCGNMGGAMARGWFAAGLPCEAFVGVDPHASKNDCAGLPSDRLLESCENLPEGFAAKVVVLAVKPQMMADVFAQVKSKLSDDCLVVSVAAGTMIEQISAGVGEDKAVVRAMPNTPAAVGAGISGLVANSAATKEQKDLATILLSAVGEVVWLDKESQINVVTALSGSGPAYVFHMVEAMAAVGVKEGLDPDIAMKLARHTVIGAGALLADSELDASELRRNVTSPGGTTSAGLDELMSTGDLAELMRRTIRAARRRGQELASK